jgi:hypothetical protein
MLAPPNPMNTTIAIDPTATIDTARTNSMIQITVNVTNAPPINGFEVTIAYQFKPWVLKAASLDYSTNVFSSFSSQDIINYCLDGNNPSGNTGLCNQPSDVAGSTSFGMTILAGLTANHTSGSLFIITFNVNTTAPVFSQIQITQAIMSNGQVDKTGKPQVIPFKTSDGYYTSRKCGLVACAPASAAFTWSPQIPKQGQVITFNGSASRPSTGESITDYNWVFGDTSGTRPYFDSCSIAGNCTNSTASYLYAVSGAYPVTLKITDSAGIHASKTIQVVVINAEVDVGIESLGVQPQPINVLPGVVFTIKAVLKNYGGVAVNASLTLKLAGPDPQSLGSLPVARMNISTTRTLTATWDSTGRAPNVYRIDAFTPILKNETNTANNHKSVWIQLVYSQPAGLSLLSTAGIAVIVVGAGGYGVSLLRRRNPNLDDAL